MARFAGLGLEPILADSDDDEGDMAFRRGGFGKKGGDNRNGKGNDAVRHTRGMTTIKHSHMQRASFACVVCLGLGGRRCACCVAIIDCHAGASAKGHGVFVAAVADTKSTANLGSFAVFFCSRKKLTRTSSIDQAVWLCAFLCASAEDRATSFMHTAGLRSTTSACRGDSSAGGVRLKNCSRLYFFLLRAHLSFSLSSTAHNCTCTRPPSVFRAAFLSRLLLLPSCSTPVDARRSIMCRSTHLP